ncbi:MAG: carbon-nitrogen hydrolase family protein [Sphingomonadales bacterium]|jgi:predicted amidohydrolase
MTNLRLSLVQMTSGDDVDQNIAQARQWIEKAVNDGAQMIATPEMTSLLTTDRHYLLSHISEEGQDKALHAFCEMAREYNIWILIGSLPIFVSEGKVANRSFFLNPSGEILARYDKIHMFDVDLPGGESYRESNLYVPGDKAIVADTPWGGLGLSVCYDLRFPHLYRALVQAGASFLAVPAAFTRPTGEAHWHVLLRARAIETGSFVFAPAQCGDHGGGRKTYGHSLIIDPWGEILAEGDEKPGIVSAELDFSRVNEVRERLPSIRLEQPFVLPGKA